MPSFPLYHKAKEELQNVKVELTDEQQLQRERDQELIDAMDDYYTPHREIWRQGGALWNLIQTGTSDVMSNWYLGWARILIGHSVALTSAGEPEGDFEPVGPSDHKKRVLWNSLTKHLINKCNWKSHQRQWLIDNHCFGNGVIKSYSELPMRKRRYERPNGKFAEKFVRDFRRAKVGLRTRSPFRCMRSHMIADPDDVKIGVERENMGWNTGAIRYGNAILSNGEKKYDTDQLPVGSHLQITHVYDEEEDGYRIYALPYGDNPEQCYAECPEKELGFPIYTKPLSRYKIEESGRTLIGGANVPGMAPLAFSTFEDQLDGDFETHAICGMGIPQMIEGPEAIMQALVNMTIDNVRLKNTVPIGYEPFDKASPSGLSVDPSYMYSGLMIDGKISPQPLGVSDVGANTVLWDWLKLIIYQLTGINPEALTGDQLNTAFQSGLLVRQMNMRAKDRITSWENGPLKRAWTLLLANALSEVTVEDWEELSEEDAVEIVGKIEKDDMTGEDFREREETDEEGNTIKIKEKRKHFYFPVRGRMFREDFKGKSKTRTLDYQGDNTLIEDKRMKGDTSYVPATEPYLLPTGKIESVMEFDVRVSGKGMLLDLQMQDMEMTGQAINNTMLVSQADPELAKTVDWKKLLLRSVQPAGFEEEDIFKSGEETSEIKNMIDEGIEELEDLSSTSDDQNIEPTVPVGAPPPQTGAPSGGIGAEQGELGGPANLLDGLASGSV